MTPWYYDLQLLLRSKVAVGSLLLLLVLTTASLLSGVQRIDSQREAIARIGALHAEDTAAVIAAHGDSVDAGTAAYYSFQPTWNPPSALAFAAVGMRDVAPIMLRVRALGLEAQIHDGDTFNPELALAGRFDFSFLLTFLLPLFAIALLHDLRSSETESGRERMLRSLPLGTRWLYLRRTTIRGLALWLCVGGPFTVVAITQGVPVGQILAVLALAALYLLFWVVLCLLISRRAWNSGVNAATLASCWVVLALVAPALANVGIERAIPVEQGATIARAHREAVNGAWDIPRDRTMQQFYANHPQWRDSAPLGDAFHYKWYLAFHQNGDDQVAPLVAGYRNGIERRNAAATAVGWALPSVGLQVALIRMAETDMQAHLSYQDRIRCYHERLRQFFYGYLFTDKPFGKSDYERIPPFEPGFTAGSELCR